MFIGRENELDKLNRMYDGDKFESVIIYGRRRVGKTTLINEFCKGKNTIFFAALESNRQMNLEAFSNAIYTNANITFKSFEDIFIHIAKLAQSERLILVIDEYPYLAESDRSISSILQNYIDHHFKATKLFLILCGSSMRFMENQVLGYQSPLYGRRTAQFKILPFDYYDTAKWFPAYTAEEKAIVYGITGGIPMYIEQFSTDKTLDENILDAVLDRNAMLFEEPSNLLKQELREPQMYNTIITAIASGKTKMSEISTTAGIESGLCSKYINNLISLDILKRETPVTNPSTKRPIYLIDDELFRFWYYFIPKNMAAIVSGRIRDSYAETVKKRLSDYMGLVFEKMCRDYVLNRYTELPFFIGEIGQWWGNDPVNKQQVQIDVVATSSDGAEMLFGSCKFKNTMIGVDELELLKRYAKVMDPRVKPHYYLFSKSGFTENLMVQSDVTLVTINEMMPND
jgi:Predicted ATPase (AAA+ superfamily)